jgi:L-malate glycosyltransferase
MVMLAPANVGHTQRWVEGLHARDVSVVLVTQHPDASWCPPEGVRVVLLPYRGMSGYFLNVPVLRRLLREERPDLLHAHYASGYGTTAALAGFRPWLLSVWGSDVYDFPYEGWLKGWWLRRNLRQADAVASTSEAMAIQVRRLVPDKDEMAVTPFGIDPDLFIPHRDEHTGVVIGTVKTLAPKYGIDVLLKAFAQVASTIDQGGPVSLVIVGGGPQRLELEALAKALGIAHQVRFVGPVPHAEVPAWLNRFDVYVAASRLDSESFGVAVLEACACEVPVVVSDVGGLPEIVEDGRTGLVVPREDAHNLAEAISRLVADPALRQRLGRAGRERVLEYYQWSHSIDRMLACCEAVVARRLRVVAQSVAKGQTN